MKLTKLSLVVLAAFSTTAMAQTTIGVTTSNTLVQGSNAQVKGQFVTIDAPSAIILKSPSIQTTGAIKTTGSVTAAKIYTGGMDVGNELINAKDSIVRNNAASIARDNVINDNITAERTARIAGDTDTLNSANAYTDGKVSVLNTTIANNALTAANATAAVQTNLDVEVANRTSEVARVDNRVTAVDNRVTKVETKTQNITATAGVTRIQGDAFIDGNISAGSGIVDRGARRGEGIYEGKAIANGNDLMSIRQEAMKYAGQVGANTLSQANNYTDQRIGEVRRETNQVGAMAMAASIVGNVSPAPGKNFALTAGMGSYGGQAALAVGFTHRVAQNVQWTASVSTVSGGRTGVGAGVSWSF